MVTIIDDFSMFFNVYLLYTKNEALNKFSIFKTKVKLKLGIKVKRLRIDKGGEYSDPNYF